MPLTMLTVSIVSGITSSKKHVRTGIHHTDGALPFLDLTDDIVLLQHAHASADRSNVAVADRSGAILFVAKDGNGEIAAVQRVFLNEDGTAKTDDTGRKVKRTNGALKGSAMLLPGQGDTLLTEEPEDALSLWQATGQPVRCAFGISSLAEAPLPAGAAVVLVADNDPPESPTHAAIGKAINRLVERGHKVKLAHPPAGAKDSNDLLRERGAEAIKAMVAEAVEMNPPPAVPRIKAPDGYAMTERGLIWRPDDPEKPIVRVSGPFEVLAETRNDHGEAWGVLLAWTDNDGRGHQWAMPRNLLAGDGSAVRERMLDHGLYVSPSNQGRQLLTSYLMAVQTDARARCVDMTGWHGSAYVTPDLVYGDTGGERVILQGGGGVAFEFCGSLEGWKTEVAALALGNSRLALVLSAAFAGPLLHLAGEDSFGFHFSGGSSSGKTTALRVSASAWGIPINTWRTTDNAAEGLARAANDGLLLLDELSQVDGRAADAMAYMLGKGRMRKDSTNKPVATWRLVFLSTGEVGLGEKIAESGKKAKAGQAVRLIEIPADAGAGHKLFESLHGFDGGDALARHLRLASDRHRGHAGAILLERITGNFPALADALREEKAEWLGRNLPAGADGQVSRVAARFALAAAAGQLATDLGLLPWPDGEAASAATVCFRAWLDRRGGVGAAEDEAGLSQVRAFIEAHGMSRFAPIGEDSAGTDAKTGAGQRPHLQFHQPLGGKADHLAQQIGISTLFQQAAKAHHLIGHRFDPWFGVRSRNQTLPKISDDHPLIAGAPGDDAFGRYAPYDIIPRKTLLHHSVGRDPWEACCDGISVSLITQISHLSLSELRRGRRR